MPFISEMFNAGVPKRFTVPGKLFMLRECFYPVAVSFFKDGRQLREDLPNALAGDGANPDGGFDEIEITASLAETVSFWIVPGGVFSQRIAGEVSVIDGSKARTLANQSFLVAAGLGAIAGQYSHIQLWNPGASMVRSVLRQVVGSTSVAGELELVRYDVPLTLLTLGNSKLLGGAPSACELRAANDVSILGVGFSLYSSYAQAMTATPPLLLAEPIIINPGFGVLLRSRVVNTTLYGSFEYLEEPI